MENFDAACQQFRTFLTVQGSDAELLWVFREDALERKQRVWLRWPLPPNGSDRAAEEYERGRRLGFGIGLQTYCVADGRLCCYVVVPDDAAEASHMMLSGGLKLGVLQNPPRATRIHRVWQWPLIGLIARQSPMLPSKWNRTS